MRTLIYSLRRKDFRVQTMRGSGAGGQHRNKTDSAVRITHPASGAVGFSQDSRSQHQNKGMAFHRMIATPEFQRWHRDQVGADAVRDTAQIEFGGPKRRTYSYPNDLVTDHRTDEKVGGVQRVLDGHLDPFLG